MRQLLKDLWKIVKELFKMWLELAAGGIGFHILMDSIQNQEYITAGAAIIFFFEMFWMVFTNRLEFVDERRKKRGTKE